MQNNIARQTTVQSSKSQLSKAQTGSVRLQPDLRDRFQGALLGLSLAPVALSAVRADEVATDACLLSSRFHQAVDCSLAQTSAFIDSPNTWRIDLAALPCPTFLLPACVPVLLRYHLSWRKRLDRLRPLAVQLAGGDAIARPFWQRFTQALVLGDLLEAINLETAALQKCDWVSWLTDCAVRYRSSPLICDQYQAVLSALSAQIEGCSDPAPWPVEQAHKAFAMGVSSAMLHPESYVLSLRRLLDCASIQSAFSGQSLVGLDVDLDIDLDANRQAEAIDGATDGPASIWVAVFTAGLLSGAWNGRCELPALWQMCSVADNQILLADGLFRLWSGQSLDRGVS